MKSNTSLAGIARVRGLGLFVNYTRHELFHLSDHLGNILITLDTLPDNSLARHRMSGACQRPVR